VYWDVYTHLSPKSCQGVYLVISILPSTAGRRSSRCEVKNSLADGCSYSDPALVNLPARPTNARKTRFPIQLHGAHCNSWSDDHDNLSSVHLIFAQPYYFIFFTHAGANLKAYKCMLVCCCVYTIILIARPQTDTATVCLLRGDEKTHVPGKCTWLLLCRCCEPLVGDVLPIVWSRWKLLRYF